ncbi:glycosyltransferase family 2 protein [Xylanimonas sp. McL0601]|uniref:glycosyltransferase family 2 protein n=1 Tax=Xylanimonas sp. McL0601 TaxID=3414739 RepID=UPI003CE877AB
MHDAPVVDVVIPTIGRASVVRAASTAVTQSIPTRVTVVLDRQSEYDNVTAMLADIPCRILCTKGGEGGSAARNLGLADASAPWVAFLDDDDWWDSTHLEGRLAAATAIAGHRPDLVLGRFVFELPSGGSRVVPDTAPAGRDQAVARYIVTRDRFRFGRNAVQTSGIVVNRELAQDVRWSNELRKHQDWDLVLRLLDRTGGEFAWDERASAHVAKGSASSVSRVPDWRHSLDWFTTYQSRIPGRAGADFLTVHVLRAALASRSFDGVRSYLVALRAAPHAAALAVGLSGIVKRG